MYFPDAKVTTIVGSVSEDIEVRTETDQFIDF
jgi:hypothetical protein